MKVTVILTVISAIGKVTKGLVLELGDLEITGRVETMQTTESLRSAKMLTILLET